MPAAPPPAPSSPSPALTGGHAAPATPVSAAQAAVECRRPRLSRAWSRRRLRPLLPTATGMGTGGGGAPMMLPPGSMGPPAGAAPPPAATVPAGTLAAGSNAPSAAPSSSGAGAGATPIPASVVAAAKRLRRASGGIRRCGGREGAGMEVAARRAGGWLPGSSGRWGFSAHQAALETVVTSNDGASYIPAGVYVPCSVRVLATDPLVDDHFRQLWFGWSDPARVLIEYRAAAP